MAVPNDVRRPVLRGLMNRLDAAAGFFYRHVFFPERGGHLMTDFCMEGPPTFIDEYRKYDGTLAAQLADPEDPARLYQVLDAMAAANSYEVVNIESMPPFLAKVWRDAGIHSSLGTSAYWGAASLGWLGAYRFTHQPAFSAEDRARANAHLQVDLLQLAAAHTLAQEQEVGIPGYAHLLPDGEVVGSSPAIESFLTHPAAAPVLSLINASGGPQQLAIQGRPLTVVPLEAPGHAVVLFQALEDAKVQLLSRLSPQQRMCAGRIAAGLTAEETAAQLGIQPDTVRCYLKEVYERLEIASQAELTEVVRNFVA